MLPYIEMLFLKSWLKISSQNVYPELVCTTGYMSMKDGVSLFVYKSRLKILREDFSGFIMPFFQKIKIST